MSRDEQHLQRHVEACLADRAEMAAWVSRAQALTPVRVTARDWLFYGHLSPQAWLCEAGLEDGDWDDWDGDWDDWDDEWDDQPSDDWDAPPRHEDDWDELDWLDWRESCEPPSLEFGGRLYPTAHVQAARALREVTAED